MIVLKDQNVIAGSLLIALINAFGNPKRKNLQDDGLEERDLAFEAGLLSPMEMELTKYATTKRGKIVYILEKLETQGLIRFHVKTPGILYKIFPTDQGQTIGQKLMEPWYMKIFHAIFRSSI